MPFKTLRKSRRPGIAALIISLGLGIAGCAYFVQEASQLITSEEQRIGPRLMMEALHQCFYDLVEMETGQRGYLLTGKEEYLAPFSQHSEALQADLAALETIAATRAVPMNREQIASFRALAQEKISELKRTIDMHEAGNRNAALALVNTDIGNETMAKIRTFVSDESARYMQWQAGTEREIKQRIRSTRNAFFLWITALAALIATAFANARSAQNAVARMAAYLEREAMHDPLTGLPNRRYLNEWLGHALARSARSGEAVAACYIDLDGFSAINNRFGHAAGDTALRWAGRVLKEKLRSSDFVARLGGDEFVVIVCGETQEEVERVAQSILKAMHDSTPLLKIPAGSVSASIGIAIASTHAVSVDKLLSAADTAMYAAKQAGKHTYRVAAVSSPA
jgi:diguanylate cyclase (GGDEF)-like protein